MGLFGGFKAKFTKDSTAKSAKNVKKDEVVCLGYRVYSEFDNPPQYLPKTTETSRQSPAIRPVAPRPKSAPNNVEFNAVQPSTSTQIESQKVAKPKIKKSSKKKASGTEKHASMVSATSTTNISKNLSSVASLNQETSKSNPNLAVPTTETVILRNGDVNNESRSAPNSVYVRGKTSSFNPNINDISSINSIDNSAEVVVQEASPTPPKSILKYKSSVYIQDLNSDISKPIKDHDTNTTMTSHENIYSDGEYDRSATLASSKTSKSKGYTTETVDYLSASQAVTKNSTTEVATYVHAEVSNSSRNDAPVMYNESNSNNSHYTTSYSSTSYNTSTIGSTSNHAANIFFGGEEEPEVQRPRRANLAILQSEEERRSSAEC